MTSLAQIQQALSTYQEPALGMDFVTAKALQKCEIQLNHVQIDLLLGFPVRHYKTELVKHLTQHLHTTIGKQYEFEIRIETKIVAHQPQKGQTSHPQIKNIIAVASGKGGVGKSTVAVNLALALHAEGSQVGILDADIYGPSQPRMLGIKQQPGIAEKTKQMLPVVGHGVHSMSIGYWVDDEQPMIWRGPMVSSALQQMLNETQWPALDYLIVDLPPGTGDIQLTLAQKIPVAGAVIVTTPQDLALLDARKAYGMLCKVHIPVLGIVENMAYYECKQCGHHEAIFDTGGGERMAGQYALPLLGRLPLQTSIRVQTESGRPTVVAEPESQLAGLYFALARKVAGQLSLQPRSYGQLFGNVKVEL